jgi:membrane-associated phospholipid phosphatase
MLSSTASRSLLALGTIVTLAASGCSADRAISVASPQSLVERASADRSPNAQRETASEHWNLVTRGVTGRHASSPLAIVRAFALVSAAQYDAALEADRRGWHGAHPAVSGAVAGAASTVLAALYSMEQPAIDEQLRADEAYFVSAPQGRGGQFSEGLAIGRRVAAEVLARAATDGSNAVWTGTVPVGPGIWVSPPPPAGPLAPLWGQVRPWFMSSGDQFRPAPPPVFGSPEFVSALAEVRQFSDTRTAEQLAVAQEWADVSSGGPMGVFSGIGLALSDAHHFDELRTAKMLATMQMAIMDASIGCWDAKFHYWYIRPFQADPAITTPVGRPPFPSYPSAHSCLSAAAAGVLIGYFPEASDDIRAQVAEAAVARIYAGLHYRFDTDAGRDLGYGVAALALEKMRGNRSLAGR